MFLVVIVRKFNACRYEEYGTKITPQYLGVKGWNSGYIESLSLIFWVSGYFISTLLFEGTMHMVFIWSVLHI